MLEDFLNTQIPKEELKNALKVIRKFKACECQEDFIFTPCLAWSKLEQLESYLKTLIIKDDKNNQDFMVPAHMVKPFVDYAEKILGEKYKALNPNKPYVLWYLHLINDEEIYRKAALFKLAMDCKIPNGHIENMQNQAVYEFIDNQLIAFINIDCLTDEEISQVCIRHLK